MKIIKRGTLPTDRIYESECNRCGTVYQFKQHEARRSADQRDGDILVTTCPVCNTDVYGSREVTQVPVHVTR